MPALKPVPSVIKVDYQFQYGLNTNCHTHLFYHTTSTAVTATQLASFATKAATAWSTNLIDRMHNSVKLETVTTTDLGHAETAAGVATPNAVGTEPGSPLTAETAVLVSLRIARRYRGGHPRLYLPCGVAGDLQDPQHWSNTFTTNMQGRMGPWTSALLGLTAPDIVCDTLASVSYYNDNAPRDTPVWDPVTSIQVQQIPGSARRRMRPG